MCHANKFKDVQMDVTRPLAIALCLGVTPNGHYYGYSFIYHKIFSYNVTTKLTPYVSS